MSKIPEHDSEKLLAFPDSCRRKPKKRGRKKGAMNKPKDSRFFAQTSPNHLENSSDKSDDECDSNLEKRKFDNIFKKEADPPTLWSILQFCSLSKVESNSSPKLQTDIHNKKIELPDDFWRFAIKKLEATTTNTNTTNTNTTNTNTTNTNTTNTNTTNATTTSTITTNADVTTIDPTTIDPTTTTTTTNTDVITANATTTNITTTNITTTNTNTTNTTNTNSSEESPSIPEAEIIQDKAEGNTSALTLSENSVGNIQTTATDSPTEIEVENPAEDKKPQPEQNEKSTEVKGNLLSEGKKKTQRASKFPKAKRIKV